ncbi:potassium channel family protein [Haloarcula sp. 1CSR25-25]|nr:potassium channel family protein [Haloarcula sp. 1CSR25-25]
MVLALGLGMWIALLWGGWMFVFASAENALRDTIDTGPISWVERFYFVGYSLFTLGNGDFAPRDGLWQILTALMTASGMLLVTLSITYVLSVLDAVTQKRTFARNVSGLGLDGEAIVTTAWNGDEFDDVALPLNSITTALNELTSNHKAYPVLHYFYTDDREAAAVLCVASLDDALTLWQRATPEAKRPSNSVLENARSSVQSYLDTVSTFATQSDEHPPLPDLAVLHKAGVPTVSDEEFDDVLEELKERRQTMHGLIQADARQWPGTREE